MYSYGCRFLKAYGCAGGVAYVEWLALLLMAGRFASVKRVGADFASYFASPIVVTSSRSYVWLGGVHFVSTVCGLLLGKWCARCVPLCPPIFLVLSCRLVVCALCLAIVVCFWVHLVCTYCTYSLRRIYTLQMGMLRMLVLLCTPTDR